MKNKITTLTGLLLASAAFAADPEFIGIGDRGNYQLSASVSEMSVLGTEGGNAGVGHYVNNTSTMTIKGVTDAAEITGSVAWWMTGAGGATTLNLTDVSLNGMTGTKCPTNLSSVAHLGVNGIINISAQDFDVSISNNVTAKQGAFYVNSANAQLNFIAQSADIIVSGNSSSAGQGNAINVTASGGLIVMKASDGNSITFSDNIYMAAGSLDIGDSSGDYTGIVSIISDEEISTLNSVTLNSGTFEFELSLDGAATKSSVSINSLNYIDGFFSMIVSQEGSYSFTLASSVSGSLTESLFGISKGYEMTNFSISGTTISFDAIAAIPEAGTCAAIFGALSLALALCKRRK